MSLPRAEGHGGRVRRRAIDSGWAQGPGRRPRGRRPQEQRRQPRWPRRRRSSLRLRRCSTSATTSSRSIPNWFDTLRLDQAAGVRERVRPGQQHLRRRPAEPPRRQVVDADRARRAEDDLRVRAVRHRRATRARPPSGCATPRASSGSFGAGQTWSPFMDPDVFPNSLEYWGPTGMVFFRNVQLRWTPVHGTPARAWSRSSGRARAATGASTRTASSCRTSSRASRCPTSPAPTRSRGDWGYVRVAGILRQIKWDDVARRPVRPVGQRHRLGHQPQLEPQGRQDDVLRAAVRLRRGHRELHERLAGRRRHREQPRQRRDADPRQAAADRRASSLFLDHNVERQVQQRGRLLAPGHRQHRRRRRPNAFKAGQYALGNLLYTPVPNVMVGGEFQWGRRENFSDGFHVRRLQAAVLVQVQLLVASFGG